MIVRSEFINDVLVVVLGQVYSNDTIAGLMNILESEVVKTAKHIVVDCSNLKEIDSMGTELFLLRERMKKKKGRLLFSALHKDAENTMNLLGKASGYSVVENFKSLDEAIGKLDRKEE